jgi:hypothetical protein
MKTNAEEVLAIELSNIESVYSGKAGLCACGCAGKYTFGTLHRELAQKRRGYSVDDDEVSDRTVKLVLNKIKKNAPLAEIFRNVDAECNPDFAGYVELTLGSRVYVAYFAH